MALIDARGLTKLYRMGDAIVRALDGVDLSIERGEFVAITGASGSGKSTMMHLLGCLDRPTGGTYILDGRDVSDLSDRELAVVRNKRIGFVFQTFNLINRTSALANVAVPLFYSRQINTRSQAVRALERVGLLQRADHQPNELSGGERQRVAIARAIVNDPLLVLADEPTGNLDTRTGEQIMEIFHKLNEQGVTIVMVTHEADIARQARRIVQMRDGRIVSDQPAAELEWGLPQTAHGSIPTGHVHATAFAADAPPRPTVVLRARPAPGATPSLVCGLVVPVLWAVMAGLCGYLAAKYRGVSFGPMKPPPADFMVAVLAVVLALLASLVMGVTAVWVSRRVSRRMREEPGLWLGRRRALAGQVLGWLGLSVAMLVVVGVVVVQMMKAT